ncbi:MAG: apolipoprotein N-acyltransferase [Chlorobiaceae bacterium]|nr:apolipoprotein N-acyltransferase [Chlorobiaceae bacterium]
MKIKFFNPMHLTPEEKKNNAKQRKLALLSGVLLGLSFPPIPLSFLAWFALVPLFFVIDKREKLHEINKAVYLTAFIFCLITLYWVGAFTEARDPYLLVAGFALLLFNPLLFLIPSTLFYFTKKYFNKKIAFLFFPIFWVTYEYAYMITDASFPWLTLANSFTTFITYIQLAEIIGALGISLLIIFTNVFIFFAIKNYIETKKIFSSNLVIAILLIILPLIYGAFQLSNYQLSDKKIKIGVVQPNLDPYEKWSGGDLNQITNLYLNLSDEVVKDGARIIIWPETALPVYLLSGAYQSIVDTIRKYVNHNSIHLLTGMPHFVFFNDPKDFPPDVKFNPTSGYHFATYNSVLHFMPFDYRIKFYGKAKLVPFGERVPFATQFPLLGELLKWGVGLGMWNEGQDTTLFQLPLNILSEEKFINDTLQVAAMVCYESVYPDFIAQFVNKGGNLLTVVTNDSWYGNTSGPYQHRDIAKLRAIENRRWVVRAANGGISSFIDPLGRETANTKMFEKTTLTDYVTIETHKTFYTKNPLLIPIICSVISIWFIGIVILLRIKKLFQTKKIE